MASGIDLTVADGKVPLPPILISTIVVVVVMLLVVEPAEEVVNGVGEIVIVPLDAVEVDEAELPCGVDKTVEVIALFPEVEEGNEVEVAVVVVVPFAPDPEVVVLPKEVVLRV